MKVLFIADSGVYGGARKSFIELVNSLYETYSVDITVCTNDWNEINEELEQCGIRSVVAKYMPAMEVMPDEYRNLHLHLNHSAQYMYASIKGMLKLEKELDLKSFDLIHTNSSRIDFGCFISKKYGIPHVMHIREFGEEDFGCWYLRPRYFEYLNQGVTRFVAISKAVKDSWIQKGIDRDKVELIYNGIDHQRIKKVSPEEQMENPDLKLVIAGGVYPTKGQYQIIEAMGRLPEDIRGNVTLAMYGWSDNRHISELIRMAARLGVGSQVKWYRAKDNVYDILCNYHVGLTCSKSEGFGRVTAEYMHAGLGVIVSDKGANPEIIHDGENGLVYHLDDYEDLASKIERFYRDREFLVSCGLNARKYAKEHYTKELNSGNIYKLYQKLSVN